MSDLPIEGHWLSIGDLGKLKGISGQAVSKRVKRLEGLGHLHPRKGPNGSKLVNVAEFERAIALTGDAVRAQNGGGGPVPSEAVDDAPAVSNPILAREQARRTAYQADLAGLDLDERLGKLVRTDEVRQGLAEAGEAIMRGYDGIASRLDDVLAVVARDGKPAGRAFLKNLGREAVLTLSRALAQRAAETTEAAA